MAWFSQFEQFETLLSEGHALVTQNEYLIATAHMPMQNNRVSLYGLYITPISHNAMNDDVQFYDNFDELYEKMVSIAADLLWQIA